MRCVQPVVDVGAHRGGRGIVIVDAPRRARSLSALTELDAAAQRAEGNAQPPSRTSTLQYLQAKPYTHIKRTGGVWVVLGLSGRGGWVLSVKAGWLAVREGVSESSQCAGSQCAL